MDNIDHGFDHDAEMISQKKKTPRGPIRVSLSICVLCVLLACVFVFMATYVSLSLYSERLVNEAYGRAAQYDKLIEIAEYYDKYYLYDVDPEDAADKLASVYGTALGDRYYSFYTADEWIESYNASRGDAVGIGIYVLMSESGDILVARVMADSPAERYGLMEGDIITAVDGVKVSKVGYEAAVDAVTDKIGTDVSFEVQRNGESLNITVTRGKYEPQTVFAETITVEKDEVYGYLHIIQFDYSTSAQFINAVNTLVNMGVKGLIFDVRNNPGGELDSVVKILDYLLPEGPIVHIVGLDSSNSETLTSDANEIDLPMVVLTNENTASAAELFTSALRDYDKAEIVGENTYGKGCGQEGMFLSDGSMVYITTFLYNPPFSENYNGVGIVPDYEIALDEAWKNTNLFLVPHEKDNQIAKAVEVLYNGYSESKP